MDTANSLNGASHNNYWPKTFPANNFDFLHHLPPPPLSHLPAHEILSAQIYDYGLNTPTLFAELSHGFINMLHCNDNNFSFTPPSTIIPAYKLNRMNKRIELCKLCSSHCSAEFGYWSGIYHKHRSTLQHYRYLIPDIHGSIDCNSCLYKSHAAYPGKTLNMIISSSTLASWTNGGFYPGDKIHIFRSFIPGAGLSNLTHAAVSELTNMGPVNLIVIGGLNDVKKYSPPRIVEKARIFKTLVKALNQDSKVIFVKLPFPPILSKLTADKYHLSSDYTSNIISVNCGFDLLNESETKLKVPGLHMYGLDRNKFYPADRRGEGTYLNATNKHNLHAWRNEAGLPMHLNDQHQFKGMKTITRFLLRLNGTVDQVDYMQMEEPHLRKEIMAPPYIPIEKLSLYDNIPECSRYEDQSTALPPLLDYEDLFGDDRNPV